MTLHDRFIVARCRFRSSNIEGLSKGAGVDELVMYAYFLGRQRAAKEALDSANAELDYCTTFVDLFAEKEILEDEI